jgi:proteasome lid subunit RPN8/RPN11
MIQWIEQPPDLQLGPLDDLLSRLPFAASVALMLNDDCAGLIDQAAKAGIYNHLRKRRIEMGGLMLGRVFDAAPCPAIVLIEGFVPSDDFEGTAVSLRMETAVWEKARLTQRVGQSVVGWYHSHPNLGAFFSGTDQRTQAAFFTQHHALGLVVDWIRNEEKWFRGPTSELLKPSQVLSLKCT